MAFERKSRSCTVIRKFAVVSKATKEEIRPSDDSQVCNGYCTAGEYDIALLLRSLNEKPFLDFQVESKGPKFIRLLGQNSEKDFFIFTFGSFVSWGATESEVEALRERLRPVERNTSATRQKESFLFRHDKETDDTTGSGAHIRNDEIILKGGGKAKLPAAYAIAQAVKVDLFENIVRETMKTVEVIPREMATYGSIKSLSSHQINTSMGRILLTWTQVRLDETELFSTPDQFWEQPEQEKVWDFFFRYLDVPRRVRIPLLLIKPWPMCA
mgnify:FL=1